MERIKTIIYKGKEIFYIDSSELGGDEVLKVILEAQKIIVESGKDNLLLLQNFTGSYANEELVKNLKNSENSKRVMSITKKSAVVGITGLKKIFFMVINMFSSTKTECFDTLEEAKEYLVRE